MDWLGAGSLALGAAGLYNSYSQGQQATSAANSSNDIAQQQLADSKAKEEYYKSIYGDLEKNLSTYYTKLTPSKAEQLGLSRYDAQFKQAHDSYTKNMAQRGLSGSGISAEGERAMQMQSATDRTNVIQQADAQTRQEQLGFLGVGLGQSNIATQNVANSARSAQQGYANQASIANQSAGQAASGVSSLISGAAYAYGRDNTVFSGSLFGGN